MDARVRKLEEGFADMRVTLARIDEKLKALATKDDLVKVEHFEIVPDSNLCFSYLGILGFSGFSDGLSAYRCHGMDICAVNFLLFGYTLESEIDGGYVRLSVSTQIMMRDIASAGGTISFIEGESERYFGKEAIEEAEQLDFIKISLDGGWGFHESIALTNKGRAHLGLPQVGFLVWLKRKLARTPS